CCEKRLMGFKLTAFHKTQSKARPYIHNDNEQSPLDSYSIIPSPRITFPVGSVRIDGKTVLALCEVAIYGENACPKGQFGLACEGLCNCANGGDCFVHSGGCPSGCAPGYTGEDCSTLTGKCKIGWFGTNCQYQCHCAGSVECDKVDGSCSSGCHSDWFGPACQYDRMGFSADKLEWLTDSNDESCNAGTSKTVAVTLDTAIPLTWIRVVVRDGGNIALIASD
ncbi:multiple epidermal growth factor-like domains protein 11-like, partial [Elysia marginata]